VEHPIELFAIAVGGIITACVAAVAFAFIAGTLAGIIQF
jgi:hypothetical protein